MTIPVALSFLAFIPVDALTLGWSNPLLRFDIAFRLTAVALCIATFLVYKKPPKTRSALLLPFAVCIALTNTIFFATATGANDSMVSTLSVFTATLIIWAFVPMSARQLTLVTLLVATSHTIALAVYQTFDIALSLSTVTLLALINVVGFIYTKNRNISERGRRVIELNLRATTNQLQQEIGTRMEAEQRAKTNETIFRIVFESSPVPLCLIDFETDMIVRANNRMSALMGFDEGKLPDRPVSEFMAEADEYASFHKAMEVPGATEHGEVLARKIDGQHLWILASSRRVVLPGQDAILASFIDITDQKAKEAELAFASQEAKKANFAKSQFLANMSHELRTPLNAIIGFSDIMLSEVFGPMENKKHLDYIKDINTSGVHLLSIINEILDLSKIESGKEDLLPELIDLNEIVIIAARLVRHHVEEKSIDLSMDLDERYFSLFADQRAVKQITLNLISNAVKFTEEGGGITVRTFPIDNRVAVEVIDTGIGIPEDKIEAITEPFVQVASTLTNHTSGTGLGLAIAKRLIELHGGTLAIESEFGIGTKVCFTLPISRDHEAAL